MALHGLMHSFKSLTHLLIGVESESGYMMVKINADTIIKNGIDSIQ